MNTKCTYAADVANMDKNILIKLYPEIFSCLAFCSGTAYFNYALFNSIA